MPTIPTELQDQVTKEVLVVSLRSLVQLTITLNCLSAAGLNTLANHGYLPRK
jgi:hypothetical protein